MRWRALAQNLPADDEDEDGDEAHYEVLQCLRRELIAVERDVWLRLRHSGAIREAAMRRLERHLDLEASHFEG